MRLPRHLNAFSRRMQPVLLIMLTLSVILPTTTHAANFSPGCTAGVGDAAALQTALTTANANVQPDTITLVAGCTYTPTATLNIASDSSNFLTINGNGATISGGNARRVFYVSPNAFLTLNSVTIANGVVAVNGAGLYNEGFAALNDSTVTGNAATGTGRGGGIYNADTHTIAITRTTFSGNSAAQGGGCITRAVRSPSDSRSLVETRQQRAEAAYAA